MATSRAIFAEPAVRVRTLTVWRGAIIAAVTATAVVELYAVITRAAGVPMKAGFLGATAASPISYGSFATGILVCTFWAAVLATALAKKAAQPARTFVKIAVVLAVISLTVPLGAGATAMATKLTLAAAHVLAAAIIIPILKRHLLVVSGSRP